MSIALNQTTAGRGRTVDPTGPTLGVDGVVAGRLGRLCRPRPEEPVAVARLARSGGQSAPAGKAAPEARRPQRRPARRSRCPNRSSRRPRSRPSRRGSTGSRPRSASSGMIQANADRQVEVRPRAAGIVREVHAVLGQKVKQGDLLVTLDSPEIGTARLNLRARQRELATARFEARWKIEIAANVSARSPSWRRASPRTSPIATRRPAMITTTRRPTTKSRGPTRSEAIEKQFADKHLGAYRGTLLQAYAEYDIASHEEQKNVDLAAARTSSASTPSSSPGTPARGSGQARGRHRTGPLRRRPGEAAGRPGACARPRRPWSTRPSGCGSWASRRISSTCSNTPTRPTPWPRRRRDLLPRSSLRSTARSSRRSPSPARRPT